MSQPAKVPEPTIDEILASIRRSIVPDDDAGKPAARKSGSRKAAPATVGASAPAGAKGRRADGEAARVGSEAVGSQGGDQATDRGTDGAPGDGHPRLKREARIPEDDPGCSDIDRLPGDPAEAEAAIPVVGRIEATESETGSAPAPDTPLLSPRTTAAVDTAFNSLAAHTVLSQNPRTLEDLVRDMLRPMLKAWLDANLPDIVERLVRAEIERVSRRG